jgi:hypothetical protein
MTSLTYDLFERWMAGYDKASDESDPQASAYLFAEDASYWESPFDEPIVGRAAIYRYWADGAERLADKRSSHEILAVRGNMGIARWQASFIVKAAGITKALDAVFLVELDEQGECVTFREWWHGQEIKA